MSFIIGLDFGTTNTCVSYYNGNEYRVIPNEYGEYITPSCIYFETTSSDILYGDLAIQKLSSSSGTTIRHFKRLLGVTYTEFVNDLDLQTFFKCLHIEKSLDSDHCSILLQHNNTLQHYHPHDLVKLYLKWLLDNVLNTITDIKREIVITVPVQFNNNKRVLLKNILYEIGFNVIKIVNEPTAATLAYISEISTNTDDTNNTSNEHVLIVDCGGGTTDLTILDADYQNMYFEVIKSEGDNFLGGEDITNNMVTYITSRIKCNITTKNIYKIQSACEKCKQNLTYKITDNVTLENLDNKDYNITISRYILENINHEWFSKFYTLLNKTCKDNQIDRIIFIGGTTRLPKIKFIIQNYFKNIPINDSLNVYHTVSMGAGFQGYLLNNNVNTTNTDVTFIDTISMSIGIRTIGDIMTPIISKNSIIPCSRTETFITTDDEKDQIKNTLDIDIYQGERRFVYDNLYIGTISIQTSQINSTDKIQITMDITSDGILIVTARNMKTETELSVTFSNYITTTLSDYTYESDLDKINDMDLSNLILAKIELNNTIKTFQSIIKENTILSNKFNILLQDAENIIKNFKNYTCEYLINYKQQLQQQFNKM